jgi:hypothetical protein
MGVVTVAQNNLINTLREMRLEVCKQCTSGNTRRFKYDRDKLWLVYTQIVPVIFEPPCIPFLKAVTSILNPLRKALTAMHVCMTCFNIKQLYVLWTEYRIYSNTRTVS